VLRLGASLVIATSLIAGNAAASAATTSRPEASPEEIFDGDQLIVRYKPQADRGQLAAAANLESSEALDNDGLAVVKVEEGEEPARALERLRSEPSVEFAEPDYKVEPAAFSVDPYADRLWGMENTGQTIGGQSGTSNIDTNAPQAWDDSKGDEVIVAVLDEGVDINHPDLEGQIWTNDDDCNDNGLDNDGNGYVNDCYGWDFFNNDNTVFDPQDVDDHGTHVAGTIGAAASNGKGVAGVSPEVKLMPLKFLGPGGGSTSDAIKAIKYAKEQGASIINCSWGGPQHSQALEEAMVDSGLVFATAAGNDSQDISAIPSYPAALDIPNQITVAAIDNRGAMSSFSNFGGTTDVGAPGQYIYSTMPKAVEATVAVRNSPTGTSGKSSVFGFGLEDVVGADKRRDLLKAELEALGATTASPIMVVDDDESSSGASNTPNTTLYYLGALTDAGFTDVEVVEVGKDSSGPTAGAMSGHHVIWQTGYASGTSAIKTLTNQDLGALKTFVEGGGSLLLAGADAIYRNDNSTLVTNTLGVDFVAESPTSTSAKGVSGSTHAGASYSLAGTESPTGTRNLYTDVIAPKKMSASAQLYVGSTTPKGAYGYKSGTSMATPHVAGVLALVRSVDPSADAVEVVNHVLASTRKLDSLAGSKTTTGGMVDAAKAVDSALSGDAPSAPQPVPAPKPGSSGTGYRFVASDGGIFSFGRSQFLGSAGANNLNSPVVSMASLADGSGYWLVAEDGGIFSFGDAKFYGSTGGTGLNKPIVGMASTPTGKGYWLVASDGGIFSFGDAKFFGSTGAIKLNKPIVGMASTPTGKGYWLVASDGGIFSFGDAKFRGSTGGTKLNKPIVGMASTPTGKGYWLVASDGGIFSFGDANFRGSTGGINLNKPIVGMTSTPTGFGYWLVASDGGIFSFGDGAFFGSTGSLKLNRPIVGMAN
jgi:subtilisin family serine protease